VRAAALATLLPLAVGPSCGAPAPPAAAEQCGEVARVYRGLQGGVALVGRPVESSAGRVAIRYEGTDDMNVPVEGTATCEFAVNDAGALALIGANVDGSELDPDAIASLRKEIGEAP